MEATTLALMDRLRARADQIDHRLGPIPGRDADAIAVELRAAADTIGVAADRLERLTAERDVLGAALSRIALGDGYYGAQAREYKQVARAALAGQPEPAAADERDAAHG